MYANHFGLRCLPFDDRADAQFFFATPEGEETLAAMEYEAHFARGILFVVGEAGMGKTLLARTLAGRLGANDRPVILQWQAGTERSLIRECCKGFGVSLPSSGPADRAVSRLRRYLMRTAKAEHNSLLIVDQAEHLSSANVEELALLAEIEGSSGKLLPVILMGQPKVLAIIEGSTEETLRQHTRGARKLGALNASETAAYIKHRLAVAGGNGVFSPDALFAIHEASRGVPRLINRSAHDALVAAFGAGAATVGLDAVAETSSSHISGARSVAAREIGLRGAEQVSSGWSGQAVSSPCDVAVGARGNAGVRTAMTEYVHDPRPPAYAYGGEVENPPAFEDGDEFYDRLAQTISRSERASATTEVTLAKAGAVEQHLEGLLGRAEAVIAALGGSVQEGESLADHIKRRLNEVASETERRVEAMESRATRTGTLTSDVEEQIQRIESSCDRAEGIERRLSAQAGQIADTADEVQQHVARISETVAGSEDARGDMERLIARASTITGSAEEKLAAVRTSVSAAIEDLVGKSALEKERLSTQVSLITGGAEEKLGAIRGATKSALEEITRETSAAEQRLVSIRTKLMATVEKAEAIERDLGDQVLSRCRQRVERELEAVERGRTESLRGLIEGARRDFDAVHEGERVRLGELALEIKAQSERAIEDARIRTAGAIGKLTGEIDRLKAGIDGVETRQSKLTSAQCGVEAAIERATDTVSSLSDQANDLDGRLVCAQGAVRTLAATATSVTEPLAASITRGEALICESETACGNLASMMDKVAAALIQTGRACEQSEAARAKALECEKIVSRFDHDTEAGRSIAEKLEKLVPSGKAVVEELSCASCEATNVAARLASQHDEAAQTAEHLDRGVTQGQQAIDRITAATITAEQAVESAAATSSRLLGRHESAERLIAEMDSLTSTGRQLHEALQGLVAHADEKTGRLGSHTAAASKILKQLADANIETHSTLKQSLEAQRKIETLTKDVWSLTTKSENCVKALTAKAEAAERISVKIGSATEQAGPIVRDLCSHVEKAIEFEKRLSSETTKAGDIVERLDSITTVLKQANDLSESVRKTVDDAKAVREELSTTMEQILPQYQQMQDALASMQGVVETSTQLKSESDASVERFVENLQASQQVIDDVETQAEALGRQMHKAKKDGDRVEQHVEALMVQPKRLLEQAQSQSAQLERVCDAVRKVFANLSKTSLEAKVRTEELQTAERQATGRLEQLIGETNATTQMLNQWVQEAINAQARLQQTVERIPSIRDTHPSDRLQRLSAPGQPMTRIANPSMQAPVRATPPSAEETARLVKAASGSKSKVASDTKEHAPTSPRAVEIARMIEEAKGAATAV